MKKIFSVLLIFTIFFSTPIFADTYPNHVPKCYDMPSYSSKEKREPFYIKNNSFGVFIKKDNETLYHPIKGMKYHSTIMVSLDEIPYIFSDKSVQDTFETLSTTEKYWALKNDKTKIKFNIDSNIVNVNGKNYAMLAPCKKIEGRIYVPLRFSLEKLGGSLSYVGGGDYEEFAQSTHKGRVDILDVSSKPSENESNFEVEEFNKAKKDFQSYNKALSVYQHYDYKTLYLIDKQTDLFYPLVNSLGNINACFLDKNTILFSIYTKKDKTTRWFTYSLVSEKIEPFKNEKYTTQFYEQQRDTDRG